MPAKRLPNASLRPHNAIEQSPRQHEAHDAGGDVTHPQIVDGAVKVALRLALGAQQEQEGGDEGGADEVEGEARVRLEAEGTGDDAEERGGDVADVGDDLGRLVLASGLGAIDGRGCCAGRSRGRWGGWLARARRAWRRVASWRRTGRGRRAGDGGSGHGCLCDVVFLIGKEELKSAQTSKG